MSDFIGSELHKSIESAKHNHEGLSNKSPYIKIAIKHWEKESDSEQVTFFSEALNLVDRYLNNGK